MGAHGIQLGKPRHAGHQDVGMPGPIFMVIALHSRRTLINNGEFVQVALEVVTRETFDVPN